MIEIELDIFSGRRNPKCVVTHPVLSNWLIRRVELLEGRFECHQDIYSYLGYRGFWIRYFDRTVYVPARLATLPEEKFDRMMLLNVHDAALSIVIQETNALPLERIDEILADMQTHWEGG